MVVKALPIGKHFDPSTPAFGMRVGKHRRRIGMLGNRALSIKVFRTYMNIYATGSKIGHPVIDQDRTRIWNGGPIGWKKNATLGYWAKVNKQIEAVTQCPPRRALLPRFNQGSSF